ncbi:MAG TPA: Ig-like domain-containing protein [Gemmatimonadaceae bacterium]|nr:Ig-like domain-containing protein [Gemmatimonadaceae bacterium]
MHVLPFALLLLAQQETQAASQATAQPSPISRIVISPTTRTVRAGDTVRFTAQAYDASGAALQNVTIRFGGGGSGAIDSTGVLIASAIGKMPIVAIGIVPGAKPFLEHRELEIIPAPASRVDIRVAPTKLVVGQQARVEAVGYSAANDRAIDPIRWTSSAPGVVRAEDGLVTAVAAGRATLTATSGNARATVTIQVVPNTITSLTITPARPKVRTGDVVKFTARARSSAGAVTGLTPTWAMQGNGVIDAEGVFVAYEPGPVVVTATLGNRSASTIVDVEERDIRRPVSIVGRLPRTEYTTAEVWVHPNGKVAYLGTHGGGDRVYTIDISNPASPRVVDSVVMNTRLVNDVMTDKAGKVLVMTREGAADRKNGIVIASLDDPLHPKVISEFTEGVTAGVHSAFVYTQPQHGTHIYLTNDGTGAVHVIDINDPRTPKEVAQWRTTNRPDAGRYVHDIDVQDGLLYASYWDDGLVILDVGKGIKGGSPSSPKLVTQFKYNLDSLYRQVEAESGPGFTRGTHTAWRHKNYVFIADEVYRASPVKGAKDEAADRMYGTLQVIDVSDIEKPKSIAWYTPENGGVHNVWVAGDTLYMGAYDGGFRVFDIGGELKGDLRAQGREIAFVSTADMEGKIQNQAMTWGVVVNPADGLAYVNDFYNGLWIVRVEPKAPPVP